MYDPGTFQWTVVTGMKMRSGCGVAMISDKIYFFGGHNGTDYLHVERFNILSGSGPEPPISCDMHDRSLL